MKIGLRTNPLHLKKDMPALIAWIADNGYESMDLPAVDAELKATVEAAGLTVGSFDLSAPVPATLGDDADLRVSAAEAIKAELSKAADLGLTTCFVVFKPADKLQPRAKSFENWKTVWPGIVAHCETLGIKIAVEPWPGPPPAYPTLGCTPETWRAMFAACDNSPAIGLCYDPSHMLRIGIDYLRALREFGDRIHHVHAKDCKIMEEDLYLQGSLTKTFGAPTFKCSEGWWRYCIPGDGDIDWRPIIVELHALGYEGALAVEPEDGVYMIDESTNRAGLLAARDFLKTVVR